MTDKQLIADEFNHFFTNVGPSLAQKFNSSDNFLKYLPPSHENHHFKFAHVSQTSINKIIDKLKPKSSHGLDGISHVCLKAIKDEIIGPLSHLINLSLQTSYIPSSFKCAKVIPLFKSIDAHQLTNYRPISLLSSFSKVLERAVFNQIYPYFEKNFFSPFQFGFHSHFETVHCITNFLNNKFHNSNDKFHIALFLDLKKAFDTVSHKILLRKLHHYGFQDKELYWMSTYLLSRSQVLSFEGVTSSPQLISCGVPHGSILGPLLFLIFTNDLPKNTRFFSNLFADDTTFQWSSNSLDSLEKDVNEELHIVHQWFTDNELTLHPDKTKYIIMNHSNLPTNNIQINLNGSILEQCGRNQICKTIKFLGILIDDKLNWKAHINMVCSKIRKNIYCLIRLKNTLSLKHKMQIYTAIIKPHLDYGLAIWGNSPHIDILHKLHKRCIRILCGSKFNAHTEPLMKTNNILKIKDLYLMRVLSFLHTAANRKCPSILSKSFKLITKNVHRQINKFSVPFAKTNYIQRLPAYQFPTLWNNCSHLSFLDIKAPRRSFLKSLKDLIIKSYKDTCLLPGCYSCLH